MLPLAALVFVLAVLAVKAAPAIRVNGWKFLTGSTWNAGSGYGGVTAHRRRRPPDRGRVRRAGR